MGLQLLLGGSGYGKSRFIYEEVLEMAAANPHINYIIIVPEQYTLQVQKKIISMHPDHVVMNIDVVSFGRLAYRVFDQLGYTLPVILEEAGKSMVIRRVMASCQKELLVFKGQVSGAGFVNEMKSTISELLQYGALPEQLNTFAEAMDKQPLLQGKIKDITKIYEAFLDYIDQRYITTEDILNQLTLVVEKSELIKNTCFYLDEFTGFTPSQYELIGELLKYSQGMKIALTVDSREDVYTPGQPYGLFHLTRETISHLNYICRQLSISREEDIILKEAKRFEKNSPLGCLEQSIYRNRFLKAYTEENQNQVRLLRFNRPIDEIRFVAEEILRLSHEGLRYREMAIVTGDLGTYGHLANWILEQAQIPCFVDETKDVLANGLAEFLRSLIEVLSKDFSYDAVFRFLKTGLTDIKFEDINRLENYVLATGISGFSIWSKDFERSYRGMEEGELPYINGVREQVMAWLMPVKEAFSVKPRTAKTCAMALIAFMEEHGIEEIMLKRAEAFMQQGQLALSKEYEQIYKVIVDILQRLMEIMQDEPMSLKVFSDVLDAGLNEAKVGIIPPGIDQVVVGDILRTRLEEVKVLFFVGVNEGVVPSAAKSGGLINDQDKGYLMDYDILLAPTGRQDTFTERFYIYSMLTKPSKHLYVSLASMDSDGKTLRPSGLIGRIQNVLPKASVEELVQGNETIDDTEIDIYGKPAVTQYIVKGLRQFKEQGVPKFWLDVYHWLKKENGLDISVETLTDMAFYTYYGSKLSKAAVKALYGQRLENSVTTLERYATCAYSHFLNYGLHLQQRQEYHFEAPDMGLLFHSALEMFANKIKASEYNWHNLPEDTRQDLIHQCVGEIMDKKQYMILFDNFRNRFLVHRLTRMVERTVWALQKQIQRGDFEPKEVELKFDFKDPENALEVQLSEDRVMGMKGVIDRLDECETDTDIYVKVIDYKTGTRKFDLAALYYGLQLQLVVYMEAAMKLRDKDAKGKNVVPAGVLYYNISDPFIKVDSACDTNENYQEHIEREVLKALSMKGLVNSDIDIIKMMDKNIDGQSTTIPVALNKNGTLSKKSSTASDYEFKKLFEYTNEKIKDIGNHIIEGDIEANPYSMSSKKTGCDYCPYKAVCGFDSKLPGHNYRKLPSLSKEQVWNRIKGKEEDNGNQVD